ncbi:unnamed protein product [Caenorhabditis bovis]|uniref:Uncharacterized protein n=1 Tax=Caenorhabditis bovis TaxID=2654633 RepID=A0A8S1EGQ4_9PELO|nr:unnamed protein product [Caenorhabditis bovis]
MIKGFKNCFPWTTLGYYQLHAYFPSKLLRHILSEILEEAEYSYHNDQQPSTSNVNMGFVKIPENFASNGKRPLVPEEIPRELQLNLSTMPRESSKSNCENIGEIMFPESIPQEAYTSVWNACEIPIFNALPEDIGSEEEILFDVLNDMLENGNVDEVFAELKTKKWPDEVFHSENSEMLFQVHRILRFAVKNARHFQETEFVLRKL